MQNTTEKNGKNQHTNLTRFLWSAKEKQVHPNPGNNIDNIVISKRKEGTNKNMGRSSSWNKPPQSNDSASCKGYSVILGTCDAARERETSKELVNLLNQAIEGLPPPPPSCLDSEDGNEAGTSDYDVDDGVGVASSSSSSSSSSIKDMLAMEIAQVKHQSHAATQNFMSINTRIKGVVMIKIMRKDLDPVQLVESIFERVRKDKMPCSRHVVRLIPLQRVFYPNEQELVDNVNLLLKNVFPHAQFPPVPIKNPPPEPTKGKKDDDIKMEVSNEKTIKEEATTEAIPSETATATATVKEEQSTTAEETTLLGKRSLSESSEQAPTSSDDHKKIKVEIHDELPQPPTQPSNVEPVVYPPLSFSVLFKARNNNAFVKNAVHKDIASVVPKFMKADYKRAKVKYSPFPPLLFSLFWLLELELGLEL